MRSFEGLRPIITEHFYMDWLTEFKLQSVIDFQKQQDEKNRHHEHFQLHQCHHERHHESKRLAMGCHG